MKFADFSEHWLFFTLLVAGPAGVNVTLWVVHAGLGNWWVATACGGSAFGVIFAIVYMTGVIIQANR